MLDFQTSLLREKFVIHDTTNKDGQEERKPLIALSNRVMLPFTIGNANTEHYIVRAQTMHICLRMAGRMASHFYEKGSLYSNDKLAFDFNDAYKGIIKGYEDKWNPSHWVAVYRNGKAIFEAGKIARHPFLDIIEKVDAMNGENYDKCVTIAEETFKKAGKGIHIEYDSNVAAILNAVDDSAKCGIILRGAHRTTTFNFSAKTSDAKPISVAQCLSTAAAYLEAIQLTFFLGLMRTRLYFDLIEKDSDEAKKCKDGEERLAQLNKTIAQLQQILNISYRPERPDINKLLLQSEQACRKEIAEEIKQHIKTGGDESDWVL